MDTDLAADLDTQERKVLHQMFWHWIHLLVYYLTRRMTSFATMVMRVTFSFDQFAIPKETIHRFQLPTNRKSRRKEQKKSRRKERKKSRRKEQKKSRRKERKKSRRKEQKDRMKACGKLKKRLG